MARTQIAHCQLYSYQEELADGRLVAGTDEAGAGPLAGPVVAAAVILPRHCSILGLNDSKQLTEKRRQALFTTITELAMAYAIVPVSVEEIDTINIYWACIRGMERAIAALKPAPEFVLSDARPLPGVMLPQQAVVKGDARCAAIAAASILAKVYRDRLMVELDSQFPEYGFAKHKGYASAVHRAALEKFGATIHHRRSFAPVRAQLGDQLGLFGSAHPPMTELAND